MIEGVRCSGWQHCATLTDAAFYWDFTTPHPVSRLISVPWCKINDQSLKTWMFYDLTPIFSELPRVINSTHPLHVFHDFVLKPNVVGTNRLCIDNVI